MSQLKNEHEYLNTTTTSILGYRNNLTLNSTTLISSSNVSGFTRLNKQH